MHTHIICCYERRLASHNDCHFAAFNLGSMFRFDFTKHIRQPTRTTIALSKTETEAFHALKPVQFTTHTHTQARKPRPSVLTMTDMMSESLSACFHDRQVISFLVQVSLSYDV